MAKKLTAGDTSFSAREFNRHVDAADIILNQGGGGGSRPGGSWDTNLVKVKNNSGDDRAKGEILEFNNLALANLDGDVPLLWFTGGSPSLSNAFGVLVRAIPAGDIDVAQVVGACQATVNVKDAAHKFARVEEGEYKLQSAASGPVRILYKPHSADYPAEVNCGVLLGASGAIELHRGITDEAIGVGSSGTVKRYDAGTDDESDDEDEVSNDIAPVADGKVVLYVQIGANFYLLAAEKVTKTILTDFRIKSGDTHIEALEESIYTDGEEGPSTETEEVWISKIPLTACPDLENPTDEEE